MNGMNYGIVVGYDGSPGSQEALGWAAREARARDLMLTVCLAWSPETPDRPVPASHSVAYDLARRESRAILDRGRDHAVSMCGAGRVCSALVGGPAAHALCDRSDPADMVVVGSAGSGVLPGSVPWQLARHGHGRIAVVRGAWRPVSESPAPVVVGVDGSVASRDAVAFAFEEAALRGVPLVAVCALADSPEHQVEEDFSHVMAIEEKERPDVTVLRQVVTGPASGSLLSSARGAQLIVVGTRGRGGRDACATSLGSVAQAVLQYATCPVGLVRDGIGP
jgi:nucleotide-binding universal stress UspA family protein